MSCNPLICLIDRKSKYITDQWKRYIQIYSCDTKWHALFWGFVFAISHITNRCLHEILEAHNTRSCNSIWQLSKHTHFFDLINYYITHSITHITIVSSFCWTWLNGVDVVGCFFLSSFPFFDVFFHVMDKLHIYWLYGSVNVRQMKFQPEHSTQHSTIVVVSYTMDFVSNVPAISFLYHIIWGGEYSSKRENKIVMVFKNSSSLTDCTRDDGIRMLQTKRTEKHTNFYWW